MRRPTASLALLLAIACGPAPQPTTTIPPTSTISVSPTTAAGTPCAEGEQGFVGDGQIAGIALPETDSAQLATITWETFEGCEHLEIEFAASGGAPAIEPPAVDATFLRRAGVVRMVFSPEVTSTAVTDQLVEGELIDRAYVVRGLDGRLFLDLHLAAPGEARVEAVGSPGRVVVDVRSGGSPYPATAAVEDLVVLISPSPGSVSYPLIIDGYSRTFEANVIVRLRQNDEVVVQEVTTSADWTETWGEFTFEIEDGPTGTVEIFVGEESAADGSERGVRIELTAA